MDAQTFIVPLLVHFQSCFTKPGFTHFEQVMRARMALLGLAHCVTEVFSVSRRSVGGGDRAREKHLKKF